MDATQPQEEPLLFPSGALGEFLNRWFSKHLHAMGEPALAELRAPTDTTAFEAYRFLRLPTFDRPEMVRVQKNADEAAEATMKVLDGRGGYHPGKVCLERIKTLSSATVETWARLMQSVETAGFWSLPTEEQPYLDKYGELISYDDLDGERSVLEGIRGERYHVVHRASPMDSESRKEGKFGALCAHFLKSMKSPRRQ